MKEQYDNIIQLLKGMLSQSNEIMHTLKTNYIDNIAPVERIEDDKIFIEKHFRDVFQIINKFKTIVNMFVSDDRISLTEKISNCEKLLVNIRTTCLAIIRDE
jgi:hypothetical protein